MRRLIRGFDGRIYHIVGNLMSQLMSASCVMNHDQPVYPLRANIIQSTVLNLWSMDLVLTFDLSVV